MVRICVLAPALKIRDKIFSNVQAAVKKLAINVIVRDDNQSHVKSYKVNKAVTTPVIMINGEIKSFGRIPDIDEITKWLEVKEIRIG